MFYCVICIKMASWHRFFTFITEAVVYNKSFVYNGTSNSGHFRGPSLVAVALDMTVEGRFYMYIFYIKKLARKGGRGD